MSYKKVFIATLVLLVAVFAVTVFRSSRLVAERPYRSSAASRSVNASSRLGRPLDLRQLTDAASIIIMGKVIDLADTGKDLERRPNLRLSFSVEKVLKGSVDTSNLTVEFTRQPDRLAFSKTLTPLMSGILFLNARTPGTYAFAEPDVEALTAVAGGPDTKADALDKVINELGNVLASSTTSYEDKVDAITALSFVDSKPASDALRRTLPIDGTIKLKADTALIRHNDTATLEKREGLLLTRDLDGSTAVPAIAAAIRDGVRSLDSLPILIRLASAPDPQVRRAAVHALREIGSPAASETLSEALNDSDQMVRYDAVMGLSETSGDLTHAPSVDVFKRNEKEYLTYWKKRPR